MTSSIEEFMVWSMGLSMDNAGTSSMDDTMDGSMDVAIASFMDKPMVSSMDGCMDTRRGRPDGTVHR